MREEASSIYEYTIVFIIYTILFVVIVFTICPKGNLLLKVSSGGGGLIVFMIGAFFNYYCWNKGKPLLGEFLFVSLGVLVVVGVGYFLYLSPWAVCG